MNDSRTYTKEELEAMPPEAAHNLMMLATKIALSSTTIQSLQAHTTKRSK